MFKSKKISKHDSEAKPLIEFDDETEKRDYERIRQSIDEGRRASSHLPTRTMAKSSLDIIPEISPETDELKRKTETWARERNQILSSEKERLSSGFAKLARGFFTSLGVKKQPALPKELEEALRFAARQLESEDIRRAKTANLKESNLACGNIESARRINGLSSIERIVFESRVLIECPTAKSYTFSRLEDNKAHSVSGVVLMIDSIDTALILEDVEDLKRSEASAISILEVSSAQIKTSKISITEGEHCKLHIENLEEWTRKIEMAGQEFHRKLKRTAFSLGVPLVFDDEQRFGVIKKAAMESGEDHTDETILDRFSERVEEFKTSYSKVIGNYPPVTNNEKVQFTDLYSAYAKGMIEAAHSFCEDFHAYQQSRNMLQNSAELKNIPFVPIYNQCKRYNISPDDTARVVKQFTASYNKWTSTVSGEISYDPAKLLRIYLDGKSAAAAQQIPFLADEYFSRITEFERGLKKTCNELEVPWPPADYDKRLEKFVPAITTTLEQVLDNFKMKIAITKEYDIARKEVDFPQKAEHIESLTYALRERSNGGKWEKHLLDVIAEFKKQQMEKKTQSAGGEARAPSRKVTI